MAVNLSPYGGVGAQFLDNAGNVLTGGKIFTYAAGTTTNQATYTDSTGTTFHPNPIILDASGRVPSGEIWLTDGLLYKFVLETSAGVLIATYDNIAGINSNFVAFTNQQEIQVATAGQTVFTLTTTNYSPGTNSLSVFVDGVNQYGPGASYAYLETNSTTVTFTTGLHVGAEVKFTTSQSNSSGGTNASVVTYDPAGVNAVPTTVQAKLRETVSVKDFGAVGNGVTNDTTAIKNAIDYGIANGASVYVPAGTYICSPNVLLFTFSTSTTGTFTFFGDGATSVLKMADGVITATGLRFFDMRPAVDMDLIELHGLVFDNNARGSPVPPSPFDYEQSHTIRYAGVAGFTTKLLRYHNVIVKDPVADGMNNQGTGLITHWIISNCSEIDRTRVRRSIQCSYLAENLVITGFTVSSPVGFGGIEAEPIAVPTTRKTIQISNCNVPILDCASGQFMSDLVTWFIDNTVVTNDTRLAESTFYISNCDLKVELDGRWNYPNANSKITNSKLRLSYDSVTGNVLGINIFSNETYFVGNTRNAGFTFENCNFLIDYEGTLPVAAQGYLLLNSQAILIASVNRSIINVKNCYFDSRAQGSVNCYRNGTWVLTDNTYACSALTPQVAAIYWGYQVGLYASNVTVNGGDFRNCVGHGLAINNTAGNSAGPLNLTGTHLGASASLITNAFTSGNIANNNQIYSSRIVQTNSLPTMGISGDTVMLTVNTLPLGSGSQYMATVISTTAPNYRVISQKGIKRDITANRPTVSANDVGLMYMDTTLDADGKVIWYNGTAWVDATGAVV